jgi:hypothetical protein
MFVPQENEEDEKQNSAEKEPEDPVGQAFPLERRRRLKSDELQKSLLGAVFC